MRNVNFIGVVAGRPTIGASISQPAFMDPDDWFANIRDYERELREEYPDHVIVVSPYES